MQIKKVDWINRPEKVRITSRTLTFRADKEFAALYTVGLEERLILRCENPSVSFLMLHTQRDWVVIARDHISLSMNGVVSRSYGEFGSELIVEKKGEEVRFLQGEKEIFRIQNPAFLDSASFGFTSKLVGEETTLFFA